MGWFGFFFFFGIRGLCILSVGVYFNFIAIVGVDFFSFICTNHIFMVVLMVLLV